MIRTFIDSGVLIYAARGEGTIAEVALQFIEKSERELASSIFLKLEVLPKSIFNKREQEIRFYESFFSAVNLALSVFQKSKGCSLTRYSLSLGNLLSDVKSPLR